MAFIVLHKPGRPENPEIAVNTQQIISIEGFDAYTSIYTTGAVGDAPYVLQVVEPLQDVLMIIRKNS